MKEMSSYVWLILFVEIVAEVFQNFELCLFQPFYKISFRFCQQ